MALPQTDSEWVTYLSLRHDDEIPDLEELNSYYEGTQPLTYMHPEVQRELDERIKPVIIAWPQLVVDAVEERLDVEGFRLPDEEEADDDLWRVWQANDMDEQSQLGQVDALTMKRYYVAVGTNEDDEATPLLTAESPLEMYVDIDPRTRRERAGLRRTAEESTFARSGERSATLYLPNKTTWFTWQGGWKVEDQDEHGLGALPVVPVVNRARLSSGRPDRLVQRRGLGTSELAPVIPLSNAANKIATDMMVAAEFLALPVRGFLGVGPDDLEDQYGNALTAIQMMMRKFLTIPGAEDGAKPFDFPGANLGGFHESINSLARLVASLAGLPPQYLGFTTDNPASADAIRSAESRLVKRAERKQRAWGGSYEQVCRLVRRFQTKEWDPRLLRLETVWRNASTPTEAQVADAATKLYTTQPEPIMPLRQVRQKVGMSPAQIRLAEEEDEERRRRDPLGEIARSMPGVPGSQDGMRDGGS